MQTRTICAAVRGEVLRASPLWESVQQVSILSATDDPRFPPMKAPKLADMHIEISVLTPLRLAKSPAEVGWWASMGVMIRKGKRGGLFFCRKCRKSRAGISDEYSIVHCAGWKANLPADAWRKPDVQLYGLS